MKAKLDDDKAVDQAEDPARSQAARECQWHRQAGACHQLGRDDSRKSRHRSDRQVEFAANQQESLANGNDAHEGDDLQDRADVPLGKKGRLQKVKQRNEE